MCHNQWGHSLLHFYSGFLQSGPSPLPPGKYRHQRMENVPPCPPPHLDNNAMSTLQLKMKPYDVPRARLCLTHCVQAILTSRPMTASTPPTSPGTPSAPGTTPSASLPRIRLGRPRCQRVRQKVRSNFSRQKKALCLA